MQRLLRPDTWTCKSHMRALWTVIGGYTLTWGAWLLCPAWDVFNSASLYSRMSDFMPEWAWGINACIAALIMLAGSWLNSWTALAWGAAAGVYHWSTISALYFVGDWRNTGGITSLVLSFVIIATWGLSKYCQRLTEGFIVNHIDEREIISDQPGRSGQPLHLPPAEG